MNNGLSLLKIINGLSKTLTIAKEVIPLYKQVKPIISNSGKLLNNINNFNLSKKEQNITPEKKEEITNSNSPIFFQ